MIVIYTWQSKVRKRRKCIRYLSYGLFTVNPIKVNVIYLHTLLYISVSRLPSNFIGIITMSSHFFEITCSVALSFLKTISCSGIAHYLGCVKKRCSSQNQSNCIVLHFNQIKASLFQYKFKSIFLTKSM